MDAWEILVANSTLGPGFDAWEYLNTQEGGSGGSVDCGSTADVDYGTLEADIGIILSAYVVDVELEANIEEVLSANADDEILTTEVCP